MVKKYAGVMIFVSTFLIVCVVFSTSTRSLSDALLSPMQDTTIQRDNSADVEKAINNLKARLKGSEKKPISEMFKNIKILDPKMQAGRLPDIMGFWSNALGVNCKHCHIVGQWEEDDQMPKESARGMYKMVDNINAVEIKAIKGMDESSRVSCWTCHRGQRHPQSRPSRPGMDRK